jgi:hypothetical protein
MEGAGFGGFGNSLKVEVAEGVGMDVLKGTPDTSISDADFEHRVLHKAAVGDEQRGELLEERLTQHLAVWLAQVRVACHSANQFAEGRRSQRQRGP